MRRAVTVRVLAAQPAGSSAPAVAMTSPDTGGTPAASARSGNGRGLIGLTERLAVYGGSLEAGEQPTGGYRVRAVFPLEELEEP